MRARFGWRLLVAGALVGAGACSESTLWLPPPGTAANTQLLIVGSAAPTALLDPKFPLSLDLDDDAPLYALGFEESAEALGLMQDNLHPRNTPPGAGESACAELAENILLASTENAGAGWSPTAASNVPSGFVCQRTPRPDEQCLNFQDFDRVVVSTTTAGLGIFELLDADRALLTLDDRRVYVVTRDDATRLPALEAQLEAAGFAVTAAWIEAPGVWWVAGTLGALAKLEITGDTYRLSSILGPTLPDDGRLPKDPFRAYENITSLGGRAVAGGVELYALTDRRKVLHKGPADSAWTVHAPAQAPPSSYGYTSLAVLESGLALGTFVLDKGVVLYDDSVQPPVVRLRDPSPNDRSCEFVLPDGDGFLVAFPSPNLFIQPAELYRLRDRVWSPAGFFTPSDDSLLTAVRLDDSLLVALTNGNFTLYPTAPDCQLARISDNGPDGIRIPKPGEMAFVQRIQTDDQIEVYWQRFRRFE